MLEWSELALHCQSGVRSDLEYGGCVFIINRLEHIHVAPLRRTAHRLQLQSEARLVRPRAHIVQPYTQLGGVGIV